MKSGRPSILYIAEAEPEAAVMSSGALAYLVEAMPQARLTVVGGPDSAPLFAQTPGLERLLVLEREGRLDWIGLWNQLRATDWFLIVDMRGSRIASRLRRQKRAVRQGDESGLHAVQAAARVLALDEVPAPRLFVDDETQAQVDLMIGDDPAPILAVGPGVDWIGKRWPAERYAKVATALFAEEPLRGGRLMIVGDEDERDAAHTIRLATARNRTIELQGRLTPLQTVAALSRASLYLGADSLWTQLAVAAGTPSVAVFGPSDEAVRGPWGGRSVRGGRTVDDFRRIDRGLNQAIQHMNDLPAERVLKAARDLLAETEAEPHEPDSAPTGDEATS